MHSIPTWASSGSVNELGPTLSMLGNENVEKMFFLVNAECFALTDIFFGADKFVSGNHSRNKMDCSDAEEAIYLLST